MLRFHRQPGVRLLCLLVCLSLCGCAHDLTLWSPLFPEQRAIDVRDTSQFPPAPIPDLPPPPTVSDPQPDITARYLSLDEAIRITLENSKVVRLLAGVSAVASGRTIYDPAISNTVIDQEQAVFDPTLQFDNTWNQTEQPQALLNPFVPGDVFISGTKTESYNLNTGLTKKFITGGIGSLNFTDTLSKFTPGPGVGSQGGVQTGFFPLNPRNQYAATLRFEQPLLKGAGIGPNLVPIVVARINTERSFFQLKDSMQQSVRGVIEAYWALVFARTDVWARQQQVRQGQFNYERAKARKEKGLGTAAEVAQTRLAFANFKANLISAEANMIQREAALRNIMGLPPSDAMRLIPISPPSMDRLKPNWQEIVRLAEEKRPDLIELKLIIEADQQLLEQARNQALPKMDAVALYRWNGLEGTTPARTHVSTNGGQFTDWMLGVNFSLPLGLRKDRAVLRQQELILARDWVNLDQGLHAAVHDLATSTRNLDQFFEQYKSFKEAREAARINLDQQLADFEAGRVIFLNVLQAITDWGNAVSAEAQALAQYNTALAEIEQQTGTILETHGIYFYEERFVSIGPMGRLAHPRLYPSAMPPTLNADLYPTMSRPAENIFDLKDPVPPKGKTP